MDIKKEKQILEKLAFDLKYLIDMAILNSYEFRFDLSSDTFLISKRLPVANAPGGFETLAISLNVTSIKKMSSGGDPVAGTYITCGV